MENDSRERKRWISAQLRGHTVALLVSVHWLARVRTHVRLLAALHSVTQSPPSPFAARPSGRFARKESLVLGSFDGVGVGLGRNSWPSFSVSVFGVGCGFGVEWGFGGMTHAYLWPGNGSASLAWASNLVTRQSETQQRCHQIPQSVLNS
ncbi:hypothetical protein OPV22_014366 [Ensete ventricosum]|uniref:Uncharacterized protein n=1 Tax=Ensete ventricosum TaxID=4639 RepID=A0AAV8R1G0_ENSVE|nr:hypothetical protein OPV22_014366 [Ensete ventricosum]